MRLSLISPAKSLNKAYLKQPLKRQQIETFKTSLNRLFSRINEDESEEHLKNIVSDFLKETYYKETNDINTKERADLVIHNGKMPSDSVGVIVETKRPTNKLEMISKKEANAKAMQELVLYYLRETVDQNNFELKHLVVTNIWEWFIFDGVWFERNIFRNTKLRNEYDDWKIGGHDTKHFYEHIAAKYLDGVSEEVPCAYFDLKDFEKAIQNSDKSADGKLTDLYKILSPEHLLKKPFANDSNSLNKEFYSELLHIIGLEENKEGSKKIIQRKSEKERDEGSLLENTITILKVRNKLKQIENPATYGEDEKTQLFSIALELCITWLNRILFLKLLEGQLIKYHRGDEAQSFLNVKRVADYDELNELFFEVLAVPADKRGKSTKEKFRELPYLNSSLFEETELESATIVVSELKGRFEIPIYSNTVLKDAKGKRATGKKRTLQYLFEFLDTYDFSSDSGNVIQEENKSIINASVLGLIFEKINGYKDGSYFTPGFITMYMCRETIRKAIVQKFRESTLSGFENLQEFDDLKDKIDGTDKNERKRANDIINSITICDPAVGSGHFLVSALNELIAVKSELQVLNYRDGSRVKGNKVIIENDELIITNDETDRLFDYVLNVNKKPIDDLQKLQEALFHEKQTIIENCLFGVDINPKSVMICRLRLWIELLKNSYYTEQSKYKDLETLPNIDINIKCGNSLISRYDVKADLGDMFRADKDLLSQYSLAVAAYKESTSKEAKAGLQKYIDSFKEKIINRFYNNHPLVAKLSKYKGQLALVENKAAVGNLFEKLSEKDIETDLKKLKTIVQETEQEIEDVKSNKLYENAFEWRFEFPEVLDGNGNFLGFDVVIGNPPYLSYYSRESAGLNAREEDYFRTTFNFLNKESKKLRINSVMFFCEIGFKLLKEQGALNFIVDFNLLENPFIAIRKFIVNNYSISRINMGLQAFEDVASGQVIGFFKKDNKFREYELIEGINGTKNKINKTDIDHETYQWAFNKYEELLSKIESGTDKLENKLELITGVAVYATETGKNLFIKNEKLGNNYYPLLEGGSSIPNAYSKPTFKNWINYNKPLEKRLNEEFDAQYFTEKGSHQRPFNLRTLEDFNRPKIFIRQSDVKLTGTYCEDIFFGNYSLFTVYLRNNNKTFLKAYLALINSKVLTFYARAKGIILLKQGKTPQLRSGQRGPIGIRQLPLKNLDSKTVENLSNLVDKVLDKRQNFPASDTSELENKIDEMVNEIYGLTKEEIKTLEEN